MGAAAKASDRAGTSNGLALVDPPRRRRRRSFDAGYVERAAQLVRRGWVSDRKGYRTRASARWRADALINALVDEVGIERGGLHRRTWRSERGRWHWAITADPSKRKR